MSWHDRGAWQAERHQGVFVGPLHPHFRSLAEQIEWEEHERRMAAPPTDLEDEEEESER